MHVVADLVADLRGALPDAAAEEDGVRSTENGEVCAEVLACAMRVHVDGQPGAVVTAVTSREQRLHVARSGDAEEARSLVQHCIDLIEVEVLALGEKCRYRRVDIAAACPHHETFEGREPHRRVERTPIAYGAGGAPVAEVEGDEAGSCVCGAFQLSPTLAHVPVRDAVESVAADAVAGCEIGGKSVRGRVRGEIVVERGVEHADHGDVFPELVAHGVRSGQGDGIVQRRQGADTLQSPQGRVIEDDRFVVLAAVHDPVADCVDPAGEQAVVAEQPAQGSYPGGVVPHRGAGAQGHIGSGAEPDDRTVLPDLFCRAGRDERPTACAGVDRVDQVDLDRRTTAVDDEDTH